MNKKRNRASNHASRVSHDGDTMGYRLMETDQITISIRAPSPPYAESQHWTPMRVMKHSHWPSIISSEAAVTLKCEFWEPPPNLKGVPIMTEFGRVDVKRFVYLEVQRVCGRPVSLAVPVYEGPLPKILDNYQMALGVSAQMQLDRDSWVPQQSAVASTPTRLAPVSSTKSRSVSVDMQNRNRHRTARSSPARRQNSNTRHQSRHLLPASVAQQSSTVPPHAKHPVLPTASTADHSSALSTMWDNPASHATGSSYCGSMSTTGWVGTPRNGTGRKDCFVPAHVGTAEPSTMNLSSPSQLVASPVGYGNPKSTTTNYTVAPCEMNGRVSQFTRHISSAGNSLPQSSWGGPSTTLDNVNWNVQTNNVIGGVSYEGPQSHGQEVFEVLQDVPRGQPLDGDNGREGCEGTPDNYGQEYFFRY